MKKELSSVFVPALAALSLSPLSFAHHAFAPHFDTSIEINLIGTITEYRFVNPHSYIYFDVEQGGETASWRCEMGPAARLKRMGWSEEFFVPGQIVDMTGNPAHREDNVCILGTMRLESGLELSRDGPLSFVSIERGGESVRAEEEIVDALDRPKYLENGQPNISGSWRTVSNGPDAVVKPSEAPIIPTAAGRVAAEGYDMRFDSPLMRCHYVNLIRGLNHARMVNEIDQGPDGITIQYGFMDVVRVIHMNLDRHPDNIAPSATGHSIGAWDGDTLVVDTIGFEPGVLEHLTGVKHSEQLHVVERFFIDEQSNYLMREYTLIDPLYIEGQYSNMDGQELVGSPYEPFNCIELTGENNIRPGERVIYHNGVGAVDFVPEEQAE
jgi:hypothetical protein